MNIKAKSIPLSSPHDFKKGEISFSKRVTNFLSDFNMKMILQVLALVTRNSRF